MMDVLTVAWELRWHILFLAGVLLLTFNIERRTIDARHNEG